MLTAIAIVMIIIGLVDFIRAAIRKDWSVGTLALNLLVFAIYVLIYHHNHPEAKPLDTASYERLIDDLQPVELSFEIDRGEYDTR